MIDLGPHGAFIWAAYGAVVFVLAALTIWIVTDARRQRRILEDLESQGVTRRSSRRQAGTEEKAS